MHVNSELQDNSEGPSYSTDNTDSSKDEQRERLALLIGQLLARQWLKEHSAAQDGRSNK